MMVGRGFRATMLFCGISVAALAGDRAVQAPVLRAGDTWVYDHTVEQGLTGFAETRMDTTIERLDDRTMVIGVKRDGAPTGYEDHLIGQDWSLQRLVDGEETTTGRPFVFPMTVGKSWTVDFKDPTRRGQQLSLHVHCTYRVVGWENVTVPAGTFHALKVEAKGVEEGEFEVPTVAAAGAAAESIGAATFSRTQRGGRKTLTMTTYAAIHYVPELKYYAKIVEERYSTDNVRVSRHTDSLISFKPATP